MSDRSRSFEITKYSPEGNTPLSDQLAVEEPLQVVIDGRPLAVLMRTPGDDEVLIFCLLYTSDAADE